MRLTRSVTAALAVLAASFAMFALLLPWAAPSRAASPPPADSSAAAETAPAAPAPVVPLLLDPLDMGFGSSAVFTRIPTSRDLNDLAYLPSVSHVVVSLPGWPEGWEALQGLQNTPLPEGADLIVLLRGYPPTRQAAEVWNYLRKPLRIVMVVDGPPADRGTILTLNAIRGLERVIADMPDPSRSGFERLQRPLSFRVVRP